MRKLEIPIVSSSGESTDGNCSNIGQGQNGDHSTTGFAFATVAGRRDAVYDVSIRSSRILVIGNDADMVKSSKGHAHI